MKRRTFYLLTLSALMLTGCVPEELRLRHNPDGDESVKIGAVLPLTGTNRRYGMKMLEGLRFATEEVNHARGLNGRQVELLVFDNTSTAEGAARATESAAAAGVTALIAGYDTNEVSAIVPLAEKLRMPTVIPLATDDEHVGANPFVFRNIYTDSQQSEALAAYLWYWRKVLHLGIMVDMDPKEEYSRNIAREVARSFSSLGGIVVGTEEFRGDNYEPALRRLLTCAPRAIVLPAEASRAAGMIKKLREMGYSGIICGPDSWDSEALFHDLIGLQNPGDCVFLGLFSGESEREEFRKFQRDFAARRFHHPGSCETQSYDALRLLLIGLSDAGDIYRFTKNWQSIRYHFGAAAIYTMLPGGKIDRTMYIKTIARPDVANPDPFSRLLVEFQYSKLETYKSSLEESD